MIWVRLNQPDKVMCDNQTAPQATAIATLILVSHGRGPGFLGPWDHIQQGTRLVSSSIHHSGAHLCSSKWFCLPFKLVKFPIYLFMMFIPTVLVGEYQPRHVPLVLLEEVKAHPFLFEDSFQALLMGVCVCEHPRCLKCFGGSVVEAVFFGHVP